MTNPADDANSRKCFPAIFRRFLCAGSLPTHPADQFTDSKFKESSGQTNPPEIKYLIKGTAENNLMQAAKISSPGVVAKLMGLDSLPAQKDRSLGSYFRSRSASSIDFLSHFDPIKPVNHHHRRVRTSVSFCEEVLNEDYTSVVLLEKWDETAGECKGEVITRRRATEKKVANKPRKMVDKNTEEKSTFQKERRPKIRVVSSKEEVVLGRKCVKRKKKRILDQSKVQSRCSMRKVHPEGSVVTEIVRPLRSRKANIGDSKSSSCSSAANSDNAVDIRAITKGSRDERKMTNEERSCYYKRMAEEICRVTEEDLKENWKVSKFDDFEEICLQFGHEILEVLLRQIVDELVFIYGTRN